MSISRIQITASPFRHFFVVKARRSNQTVHHFPRNPFQIGVFSQKFRFPICSEYVNKVPLSRISFFEAWQCFLPRTIKYLMMILWIPENCVYRFYFRFMPITKKECIPLDHSCKKCFCLREPVFLGRIFLILRRNFPNELSDFFLSSEWTFLIFRMNFPNFPNELSWFS